MLVGGMTCLKLRDAVLMDASIPDDYWHDYWVVVASGTDLVVEGVVYDSC